MNKNLLSFILLSGGLMLSHNLSAQNSLAPDQNPQFETSKTKYMAMADSVNAWHSTTTQETYKAIDYLEDKKLARHERQEFRRELRLERARSNYYSNRYYMPYDNYNYNRFRNNNWYRSPRMYRSNFGGGYYRNNNSLLWSAVPLALTFALLCR